HEGGRWWTFPSGARLSFGHLLRDGDKYKYQSAEYQFVGFDELTHFQEDQYSYLFSRVRRPQVPCLVCQRPVKKNQVTGWSHVERKSKCTNCFPDPGTLER